MGKKKQRVSNLIPSVLIASGGIQAIQKSYFYAIVLYCTTSLGCAVEIGKNIPTQSKIKDFCQLPRGGSLWRS